MLFCSVNFTQSCLTLCDHVDCSLPDSSACGIFQARILEWVVIFFSRGSSWPQGLNPSLPCLRTGKQVLTTKSPGNPFEVLGAVFWSPSPLFSAPPSHFLGEGSGTPLQYSCLESPMGGGAWWAAVHGVTKSRTWLSGFTFTFHFSCIGEENGSPLQYSCLENLRDWGAWWAAVYGVTQSWTRLKWLSSKPLFEWKQYVS